jgi:hypothetical protein
MDVFRGTVPLIKHHLEFIGSHKIGLEWGEGGGRGACDADVVDLGPMVWN